MNYRHLFHAGSFADVHKHALLTLVLSAYLAKNKPFVYIDTHAGIGLYDLTADEAKRNPEYESGIMKIMDAQHTSPDLKKYLEIIKPYWNKKSYPGSPLIAQTLLTKNDHLILNEYHPDDANTLKLLFESEDNVHCHKRDAYEFLPAALPPEPRRAVILIDPPYEKKSEFTDLFSLIEKSYAKFPQGCFMIWYPITEGEHLLFTKKLIKQFGSEKCVIDEIILPDHLVKAGLRGSGMAVINPPYQTAGKMLAVSKEIKTKNR